MSYLRSNQGLYLADLRNVSCAVQGPDAAVRSFVDPNLILHHDGVMVDALSAGMQYVWYDEVR